MIRESKHPYPFRILLPRISEGTDVGQGPFDSGGRSLRVRQPALRVTGDQVASESAIGTMSE